MKRRMLEKFENDKSKQPKVNSSQVKSDFQLNNFFKFALGSEFDIETSSEVRLLTLIFKNVDIDLADSDKFYITQKLLKNPNQPTLAKLVNIEGLRRSFLDARLAILEVFYEQLKGVKNLEALGWVKQTLKEYIVEGFKSDNSNTLSEVKTAVESSDSDAVSGAVSNVIAENNLPDDRFEEGEEAAVRAAIQASLLAFNGVAAPAPRSRVVLFPPAFDEIATMSTQSDSENEYDESFDYFEEHEGLEYVQEEASEEEVSPLVTNPEASNNRTPSPDLD